MILLNWYLKVVLEPIPYAVFWSHKGFWRAKTNFMARNRVHLNGLGQDKLYRSLRAGSTTLPTIAINANHGICKKIDTSSYLYRPPCPGIFDFPFIVLRFVSSFYVLSQANCPFHSRLFALVLFPRATAMFVQLI